MKLRTFITAIAMMCALTVSAAGKKKTPAPQPVFNRAPLVETPYAQLPIGEIKPEGWLGEQMQIMLNGMTGDLDQLYELVCGDNNAWLGGEGDAWERGPYWIDGALPMAYIMGDEALKAKSLKWVEAILASQKESGSFGPDTDRPYMYGMQRGNALDWWPRMVALKILQQYYMATADERVVEFMTNYFHYQLKELPKTPLGNWTFWATERAGDNLLIVHWLYNITGDEKLLQLGEILHQQSADWTGRFTTNDHLFRQNSIHCVNLGQGFKEPVIWWQQSKEDKFLNAPQEALRRIRQTIGFPTGLWAGDELIHFGDPTRGSELCTATEMMYSLEEMYRITGDNTYADLLERITYNALPTQITDKGDARQYYQQINQVEVTRKPRNFSTPHNSTDILFGVLSGYPCCTCNLHQGWPKFVQNLWLKSAEGGVAAMVYAPSTLSTTVNDVAVVINEQTCYPFEEQVAFSFSFPDKKQKSAAFPFDLRVPAWSKGYTLTVNGAEVKAESPRKGTIRLNREWADGDQVVITFNAEVAISRWYDYSAVVERGPLVYALRMEERWMRHECNEDDARWLGPYYYEVTSPTPWNVALRDKDLHGEAVAQNFIVEKGECSNTPWTLNGAPIKIKAKANMLPNWHMHRNSAGPINYLTQQEPAGEVGAEVDITLIPYGCTTLRMTEFPVR
ncbi:MAG: glycoside hydrolase family 127 protein [Alistipes sp.]|nr:glycoside hydrolase family 127 protein [Alistipes sp.]